MEHSTYAFRELLLDLEANRLEAFARANDQAFARVEVVTEGRRLEVGTYSPLLEAVGAYTVGTWKTTQDFVEVCRLVLKIQDEFDRDLDRALGLDDSWTDTKHPPVTDTYDVATLSANVQRIAEQYSDRIEKLQTAFEAAWDTFTRDWEELLRRFEACVEMFAAGEAVRDAAEVVYAETVVEVHAAAAVAWSLAEAAPAVWSSLADPGARL